MRYLRRVAVVAATLAAALPLVAAPVAADPGGDVGTQIAGGENATSADGMAAVHVNGNYICSGSIVGQRWVLTARHCLYDGGVRIPNEDITVRVKSLRRSSGGGVVAVETSRVRTNNDIALLKLNRSANAEPVRLPKATTKVGAVNFVFGWGITCDTCTVASEVLKRGRVAVTRINSTGEEGDLYGGNAIVAVSDAPAAEICFGDSGGPLFKLVDGKRYQVGVTSGFLSNNPGNCGQPMHFATVPASRKWILKVMATV